MRVLVIDVLDFDPDDVEPMETASLLGHAYLHLALVNFESSLEMDLSVYDNQSAEIARLGISLRIDFTAPVHGAFQHLSNSGSAGDDDGPHPRIIVPESLRLQSARMKAKGTMQEQRMGRQSLSARARELR